MTIRTIIVPVRGDGKGEGVLDHALAVATPFNAHVDVVHCRPRPEDLMPFGIPLNKALREAIQSSVNQTAGGEEEKLVGLFEDWCQRHGVAVDDQPPGPADKVSASWREETGKMANVVAVRGRLADVIAIARPDPEQNLGYNTLESALMNTGKLVMLCPARPVKTVGTHVAIGWNGSSQASRAVTSAMPILRKADKVTILCAPTRTQGVLTADDLRRYLAWHEVEADQKTFESRERDVGRDLVENTKSAGADMLLMGAWGHSRQREMVLGGATEYVTEHADIPVLLER